MAVPVVKHRLFKHRDSPGPQHRRHHGGLSVRGEAGVRRGANRRRRGEPLRGQKAKAVRLPADTATGALQGLQHRRQMLRTRPAQAEASAGGRRRAQEGGRLHPIRHHLMGRPGEQAPLDLQHGGARAVNFSAARF